MADLEDSWGVTGSKDMRCDLWDMNMSISSAHLPVAFGHSPCCELHPAEIWLCHCLSPQQPHHGPFSWFCALYMGCLGEEPFIHKKHDRASFTGWQWTYSSNAPGRWWQLTEHQELYWALRRTRIPCTFNKALNKKRVSEFGVHSFLQVGLGNAFDSRTSIQGWEPGCVLNPLNMNIMLSMGTHHFIPDERNASWMAWSNSFI